MKSNAKVPAPKGDSTGCVLVPVTSMFGKGETNCWMPLLASGMEIGVAAAGELTPRPMNDNPEMMAAKASRLRLAGKGRSDIGMLLVWVAYG
jgi:hypothetical protein